MFNQMLNGRGTIVGGVHRNFTAIFFFRARTEVVGSVVHLQGGIAIESNHVEITGVVVGGRCWREVQSGKQAKGVVLVIGVVREVVLEIERGGSKLVVGC
jgi:hypothetical protein